MLKEISSRVASLESAAAIKNSEGQSNVDVLSALAARNAPVVENADGATGTSVVTKDEDNGISVKNAETERRALAEMLADLPEQERQKALAGLILKASHK